MTTQYLPRRLADLAATIPGDLEQLADLVEAEDAARARLVDARRALDAAQLAVDTATSAREGLEGEIKAVRNLLELGQQQYGWPIAALIAPGLPITPRVTPSQGVPVVRVAEPSGGYPYCDHCHAELIREVPEGRWVHCDTGRAECPAEPVDADATQVLAPVAQNGGEQA